jgi:hypothetical protein
VKIQDIQSTQELIDWVEQTTDDRVAQAEAEQKALGIDQATTDTSVESAGIDVQQASDGNLTSDDYVAKHDAPTLTTPGAPQFQITFENTRRQLMFEGASNLNAFTRQALIRARDLIDEIDALLGEMAAEAAKVSVASAAGLLVPPAREEVVDLRTQTATVHEQTVKTTENLRSAKARRDAAKRHLQNDPLVPVATPDQGKVDHRFLEPLVETPASPPTTLSDGYVAASRTAPSLQAQSQATGRVDQRLTTATTDLQSSVLDRVGHIAICLAIASLDQSQKNKERAERLFKRLATLVTSIQESMGAGFLSQMQGAFQELIAQTLDNVANTIQQKLDAFDTWLALAPKALPTFVSIVDNIGDRASDLPILENLASYCDLNMTSFCQAQGLLEIAKSLDAEVAKFLPRSPALGRVNLLVLAPPAEDYRPPEPNPDRETDMYLVSLAGTTLVTRLPYAEVRRRHTQPLPPFAATLSEEATAEALNLNATWPGTEKPAHLGQVTINPGFPTQQVLRYSLYDAGVFTLIDPVTTTVPAGTSVSITGEQRDNFQAGFEPHPNISGGPGSLEIEGVGELRETLDYSSSTFDTATGHYTFQLTTAPTVAHSFNILCRPHASKKLLFKSGSDMRTLAQRFRVVGDEVHHQTIGNFNFATEIDVDDYGPGGQYLLVIDVDGLGVEINPTTSTPTTGMLKLRAGTYYDGNLDNVTLSRVPRHRPKGSTTILVQLDGLQKKDLLVVDWPNPGDELAIGATSTAVAGRVIADGGEGTTRANGTTTAIWGTTSEVQMLTIKEPMVMGDEAGMTIEVQGAVSRFTATVTSVNTATNQIICRSLAKEGKVSVDGGDPTKLIGTGTKFLNEFQVGDYVHVQDTGVVRTIAAITDNTHMQLGVAVTVVSGKDLFIVAPAGTTMVKSFSILRTPREDNLTFTSITNVDGSVYALNLSTTTSRVHGLQDPEIKPSVRVISQTRQDYLDHFEDLDDNKVPRFDGKSVPPGINVVRAELEFPEYALFQRPLVLAATNVWAQGRELPLTSVTESGGEYVFTLTNALTFPLADGETIYVETTSLADQIEVTFNSTWSQPFDEFFVEIAKLLREWESKLCRLLQGRPLDIGITAAAVSTLLSIVRMALLPLRFGLEMMIAGLEPSDTIDQAIKTFDTMGMDSAAEITRSGDILGIAQLTVSTATSEGQAREAIKQYQLEITWATESRTADELASALTAQEYDKQLLAEHRRTHKDIVKDQTVKQVEAAKVIKSKAEQIAELERQGMRTEDAAWLIGDD